MFVFSAILHYRLWGFAAGLVNAFDMDPSTPHRNHMESQITWRETVSCNFRQAQGYEDVVKNLPLISGTRPAHGLMIYCKGLVEAHILFPGIGLQF